MERLQKILSQAGVASRRSSEHLMLEGRVTVNGVTVTALGSKADPSSDDIRVDGRRITVVERRRYILLNKPRGYVTTRHDPQRRPTVIDLVGGVREYVYPVGRLDFESEGLLLLTNDGDLAARLTHPRHGVARVYEARVLGRPDARDVQRLARGIVIDGRRPAPGPRRLGALHAAHHAAGRPEPPGAAHVRRGRPSGRSPPARRDWTAARRAAEAGTMARADRRRSAPPAAGDAPARPPVTRLGALLLAAAIAVQAGAFI